jgi:hemolysin activation/secretion protein
MSNSRLIFALSTIIGISAFLPSPAVFATAATDNIPDTIPTDLPLQYAQANPPNDFQRPATPTTEPPKPLLPPVQEILPTPAPVNPAQPNLPSDLPAQVTIKQFVVTGSTVFSPAELAAETAAYINRPINFNELLEATNKITQLYVSKGYVTSGAYLPANQTFDSTGGIVKIQIVEGTVADIVVAGTQRLDPNYIRSRIALGTGKPLKVDRLVEALQLLQLDPLIKSISSELIAGQKTGSSVLQINVSEAPTWRAGVNFANNRAPSVGELQVQTSIGQNNLLGYGDSLVATYGRNEGSSATDVSYTLPVNAHNGTVRLQYSNSSSKVIEVPFDQLDINGNSQDISFTYRQPVIQTPSRELALGLTVAKRETISTFLPQKIGYPSPGADVNGSTRVTALRFFQDYTQRDSQQVFAARSQLSVGASALNSTVSPVSPDGSFVSWRGQTQYVRSLGPNSILLMKLDAQLADRPLLSLEQIGLGGQESVRGYRQDFLLADNGITTGAEIRIPILQKGNQLLQIAPFIDLGYAWNHPGSSVLSTNLLSAGGLGLRYQAGENFNARLDYGIPFSPVNINKRTGQENGFHFSLNYNTSF